MKSDEAFGTDLTDERSYFQRIHDRDVCNGFPIRSTITVQYSLIFFHFYEKVCLIASAYKRVPSLFRLLRLEFVAQLVYVRCVWHDECFSLGGSQSQVG